MKRTNILFILSDQHNAKVVGHAGHLDVKTPNLDRLAAEGVRFENAICQNPICTPSRMCYLSGQYAHNHGYYGLGGGNPGGLPTLLGHFRRAGYRTAAIGKIHCPEYWVEDDCDVFHETCGCSIGGRSPKYSRYLAERGLTDLEDHGAMHEMGARGRQTCDARPSMVSYADGQEGWIVREATAFMRQSAADGFPFLAHVSLPKPHQCYTPAREFWDLYPENDLHLPPNADYAMEGKAPHLRAAAAHWRQSDWPLFEPRTYEAARLRKLHGYLGNVSHVDHAVGELLTALDRAGIAENTIVLYASDHGDYACEQGIMEKAPGICSDAITRVPFLWRQPGRFPAGRTCAELVESVDVSATLCSLAALPPMETSDGKDLSALLQGQSGAVRNVAVTEFAWSKSIRKGEFRLVWYPREMFAKDYPDGFGELYDLGSDPWEMRNLFFEATYRAKVEELRADLLEWLVTTTRPSTVLQVNGHLAACEEPVDLAQRKERYGKWTNRDGKINPAEVRKQAGANYV